MGISIQLMGGFGLGVAIHIIGIIELVLGPFIILIGNVDLLEDDDE